MVAQLQQLLLSTAEGGGTGLMLLSMSSEQ